MNPRVFRKFCRIAYEKAGIYLKPGKEAMVLSRIRKRMRILDLQSPESYLSRLEADESGEELIQFLDVITTNYTSFYRESDHFDFMKVIVQDWLEEGQRQFRFWSTAAATGEEPYSMAFTLLDLFENNLVDFRILATDLSRQALQQASNGRYDIDRLVTVPNSHRVHYFRPIEGSETRFQVLPLVRQHIVFKRLNLAKPPFPMRGPMDIVFCRNVMIYFDRAVRQALVTQIEKLLKPGGFLFVGHVETLAGLASGFIGIHPSIYQKPD